MATLLGLLPTIISLFSAAVGMIFLFLGSFSENQFEGDVTLKIFVFTILTFLLGAFMFNARKCIRLLENACRKHFLVKTLVKSLLLGFTSMVNFLIKYPRFNAHSIGDTQRNKLSGRSQFNLYSVGSFSVFSIVISSKRQQAMELGVSDFLLGLTMDASMEIPGKGGPNLWYVLVTYVYCVATIFTRSYFESLKVRKSISPGTGGKIHIHDLEMVMVIGDAGEEESTVTLGGFDPATEIFYETTPLILEEIERNIPRDTSGLEKVDITNGGYAIIPSEIPRLKNLRCLSLFLPKSKLRKSKLPYSPSQAPNFSILVEINLMLSHFLRLFGDIPIGGERVVSETFKDNRGSSSTSNELSVVEHQSGAVEKGRVTRDTLLKEGIRQMDGLRRRKNISAMLPNLQTINVYNDNHELLTRKLE